MLHYVQHDKGKSGDIHYTRLSFWATAKNLLSAMQVG